MAEAALSFAEEKLHGLVVKEVGFLLGVEKDFNWLKKELEMMQCFLKDAADKQDNDHRIRQWISDIREVAHDAEDAVDTFILKVDSPRRSRGPLKRCVYLPNEMYHLHKVGRQIESIKKKLQDIKERRDKYGIKDLGEGMDLSRRPHDVKWRRRSNWQNAKHVVGFEKDVEMLLRKAILDKTKGLCITTITGLPGIGKSTFANQMYSHADVAGRFDCRAWVVVSSEFAREDIFKEIMLKLQNSEEDRQKILNDTKELEESMQDKLRVQEMFEEMLRKQLEGKQFFIVLDDVWEAADWKSLRPAFPNEEDKASRLLLTSRNRVVTSARYVHEMKVLDEVKSWELFLKEAFPHNIDGSCPEDLGGSCPEELENIGRQISCPEELENIGRQILKKCGGLPLAITVVGGLLANQRQLKSEWENVLKGMDSNSGRSEDDVSRILELSYLNLSPQLKSCFLCLSFFKEDATIRSERLVNIWIAEGLVPDEGGERTKEEIGRSCLHELINRNLIQVKKMTMDDRVRSCYMHDLLRKLSIAKAKEEISFESLSAEGNSQSLHKPRHLAVYYSGERLKHSKNQNKHLRSVLFYGNVKLREFENLGSLFYWKSFKLLSVLDFEDFRSLENPPESIGAIIGLRYLGLRNSIIFMELPHAWGRLKKLEVLDLSMNDRVSLPNVLWKLEGLRHLYADDIRSEAPLEMGTMKNIQTLSYISITSLTFEHVAELTSLRKLGIVLHSHSDLSELYKSLAKLKYFASLSIRFEDYTYTVGLRYFEKLLHGLGLLHRLTKLKLNGHFFYRNQVTPCR